MASNCSILRRLFFLKSSTYVAQTCIYYCTHVWRVLFSSHATCSSRLHLHTGTHVPITYIFTIYNTRQQATHRYVVCTYSHITSTCISKKTVTSVLPGMLYKYHQAWSFLVLRLILKRSSPGRIGALVLYGRRTVGIYNIYNIQQQQQQSTRTIIVVPHCSETYNTRYTLSNILLYLQVICHQNRSAVLNGFQVVPSAIYFCLFRIFYFVTCRHEHCTRYLVVYTKYRVNLYLVQVIVARTYSFIASCCFSPRAWVR